MSQNSPEHLPKENKTAKSHGGKTAVALYMSQERPLRVCEHPI